MEEFLVIALSSAIIVGIFFLYDVIKRKIKNKISAKPKPTNTKNKTNNSNDTNNNDKFLWE